MEYTFSLSNDVELIKSVTLLPNNIDYNYDDNFEDPQSFNPPIIDSIYYIKVEKDGVFLGFFFLIKRCDGIAEAHLAFLPIAYGQVHKAGKECIQWIWDNTDFDTLISPVIEDNTYAMNSVLKMGFEAYGRKNRAWLKHGIYHNYIWLKVSKSKTP